MTTRADVERMLRERLAARRVLPAAGDAPLLMALGRVREEAGGVWRVLDEAGRPRESDSRGIEPGLDGLVEDIARRHPVLFEPPPPPPRDWLSLGPMRTPPGAPAPSDPAAAAPPAPAPRPALVDGIRAGLSRLRPAEAAPRSATPPAPREAPPREAAPAAPERRRRGPRAGAVLAASVAALGLLSLYGLGGARDGESRDDPAPERTGTLAQRTDEAPPAEEATRAVQAPAPAPVPPARPAAPAPAAPAAPAPAAGGALSGVPEVIDTVTLVVEGQVLRLHGVEWAPGGNVQDLRAYLGSREVTCEPVEGVPEHRCLVEGRDLSLVVLWNGGARAAPSAAPELKAAEERARSERIGVFAR